MSKLATALRPGQRAAVTNGRRVFVVSCPRSSPVVAYVLAGIGVKGDTGGRTRSAARRASTERVRMAGEAFTLDADGGHRAYRQGGRTRAPPAAPAPADSRARTDAGCNRSGCPSEARSLPTGDRNPRSSKIRCHQRKQRAQGALIVFAGPCRHAP